MSIPKEIQEKRDKLAHDYALRGPSGGYSNMWCCGRTLFNAAWELAEEYWHKRFLQIDTEAKDWADKVFKTLKDTPNG